MTVSYDPDDPDAPPLDLPGITRPHTDEEVFTSALTILDEVETVLIHLTDPTIQEKIGAIMAEHAGDHSGYGGLIDWVQITAHGIRNHLNNQ